MIRQYCIVSFYLFSITSVVYGGLNGGTFMLTPPYQGFLFGIYVTVPMVLGVIAVVRYTLSLSFECIDVVNLWKRSVGLTVAIICLIMLLLNVVGHDGKFYRIYISTFSFYLLIIFSIYTLLNANKQSNKLKKMRFNYLLSGLLFFVLGLCVNVVGDNFFQSSWFDMSKLISYFFCIVLPLCSLIGYLYEKKLA